MACQYATDDDVCLSACGKCTTPWNLIFICLKCIIKTAFNWENVQLYIEWMAVAFKIPLSSWTLLFCVNWVILEPLTTPLSLSPYLMPAWNVTFDRKQLIFKCIQDDGNHSSSTWFHALLASLFLWLFNTKYIKVDKYTFSYCWTTHSQSYTWAIICSASCTLQRRTLSHWIISFDSIVCLVVETFKQHFPRTFCIRFKFSFFFFFKM